MARRIYHRIDFTVIPPEGTSYLHDGQRYVLIGSELYRRNDGALTTLLLWESSCPECQRPFIVKTTLKHLKPLNRRCPKHHAKGRAVTVAGRKRQRRGYRKHLRQGGLV